MGDKKTEDKEQDRNRSGEKKLKSMCPVQRQCLSPLNYNGRKVCWFQLPTLTKSPLLGR